MCAYFSKSEDEASEAMKKVRGGSRNIENGGRFHGWGVKKILVFKRIKWLFPLIFSSVVNFPFLLA